MNKHLIIKDFSGEVLFDGDDYLPDNIELRSKIGSAIIGVREVVKIEATKSED